MTTLKAALCLAATLAASAAAHATSLTGASVTGTLAFGPDGGNGGQRWPTSTATIGDGVEFSYQDGANHDTADFTGSQLIVRDQVFVDANGWEMTFTTPGGFQQLQLVGSSFAPGLTYSLTGGQITLDWRGSSVSSDMAATFNLVPVPVPEPETWALMGAGLAVVGGAAARRRRA